MLGESLFEVSCVATIEFFWEGFALKNVSVKHFKALMRLKTMERKKFEAMWACQPRPEPY